MNKYNDIKVLVDVEVSPLIDILLKLSNICNNFSSTANRIANIDIRETHEIKEFLELTFDARRIAKKVEEVVEFRADVVIEAAKCCYYETIPHKEDEDKRFNDINSIIAAGNKFVNKNVTNKGNEKNQGKKDGKNTEENAKGKKDEKEEVKPKDGGPKEANPKDGNLKDANHKEKAPEGTDKDKKETEKEDQE
jgi:hypothetical protein